MKPERGRIYGLQPWSVERDRYRIGRLAWDEFVRCGVVVAKVATGDKGETVIKTAEGLIIPADALTKYEEE